MIAKIFSIILKMVEGRWVINQTKKAGLLFYLRFLSCLRSGLIGIILVIFAFQIFVFSFIGLVLGGVYLSPYDLETKVFILLGICATTFVLAVGFMAFALSEKTWLKYSGATEYISKLD